MCDRCGELEEKIDELESQLGDAHVLLTRARETVTGVSMRRDPASWGRIISVAISEEMLRVGPVDRLAEQIAKEVYHRILAEVKHRGRGLSQFDDGIWSAALAQKFYGNGIVQAVAAGNYTASGIALQQQQVSDWVASAALAMKEAIDNDILKMVYESNEQTWWERVKNKVREVIPW